MRLNHHCRHLWKAPDVPAGGDTRLSVSLPADLLKRLRSLSLSEGLSVPAIIEFTVVDFLEESRE